ITCVFLLGVFWRRMNAKGAMAALLLGFVLGVGKLTLQAVFGEGTLEDPAVLAAIADFNFLFFSSVLFVICVLTMIIVALTTGPPAPERLRGNTYASLTAEERAGIRASWNAWDIVLTAAVLVLVVGS